MRILLVDDDRELIDLLAFALKRAGLEPIAAHDAAGALRLYEERQPDLVVLDINLGAQSGLDVLRELRRRGQLPVIMLTALDSEAEGLYQLRTTHIGFRQDDKVGAQMRTRPTSG